MAGAMAAPAPAAHAKPQPRVPQQAGGSHSTHGGVMCDHGDPVPKSSACRACASAVADAKRVGLSLLSAYAIDAAQLSLPNAAMYIVLAEDLVRICLHAAPWCHVVHSPHVLLGTAPACVACVNRVILRQYLCSVDIEGV